VVGTVTKLLDREGKQAFVRNSQRPGLVAFKRSYDGIRAWVYADSTSVLPLPQEEMQSHQWAVELIAQVQKGSR
jgi:hypothetical protein